MTELFDAVGIFFLYSLTFIVVAAGCAACIFLAIDAYRKPKEGPLSPYQAPR